MLAAARVRRKAPKATELLKAASVPSVTYTTFRWATRRARPSWSVEDLKLWLKDC